MPKVLEIKNANKIAVFGDIHGDLESLTKGYNIAEKNDVDYFIFLGDYADRGENGPEVIEFIQKKQEGNERIIPLKGNHESYNLTEEGLEPNFSPCDLVYQYKRSIKRLYNWFESLPVGAIIPGKYFFVHGGISDKIDLTNLDDVMVENLLWSDPIESYGDYPNSRGAGRFFGPDVSDKFISRFNIKTIIRSHQPDIASIGYAVHQSGRILTLSSTRIYDGKSAVLIVDAKKPAMDAYQLSEDVRVIL